MRNHIFLSHANPEDNTFTKWLALRLAAEGYAVWCDLTKLLGGERFWEDIEDAIREHTFKFLYVLSSVSNQKHGALNELTVAQNVARGNKLKDFVIPLRIDALSHGDMNIQLASLNAISFTNGWASGLSQLLLKLEEDNTPKDKRFSPQAVTDWWQQQFQDKQFSLSEEQDQHFSNWFQIEMPKEIHFHHLAHENSDMKYPEIPKFGFPAIQQHEYLVTFATAAEIKSEIARYLSLKQTRSFELGRFTKGQVGIGNFSQFSNQNTLTRLFNLSWAAMLQERGLPVYELANNAFTFYFPKDFFQGNRITFTGTEKKNWRQVVGYKTIGAVNGVPQLRYWHFGLEAKFNTFPRLSIVMKPHVLFSTDGQKIWESKARLHKARRSQCKDWWNADWRDRILASLFWLGNGQEIELKLTGSQRTTISVKPDIFVSPVSYLEPGEIPEAIAENDQIEVDDDEESDGNDEE